MSLVSSESCLLFVELLQVLQQSFLFWKATHGSAILQLGLMPSLPIFHHARVAGAAHVGAMIDVLPGNVATLDVLLHGVHTAIHCFDEGLLRIHSH